MGQSQAIPSIGKHSTAKQIVEAFGTNKYLQGSIICYC